MSGQPHHIFTEKEYWLHEERSLDKHEYYRGEVFLMAGGTKQHNAIVARICTVLRNQLRGRSCQPFSSHQRIKLLKCGLQTYPDVSVICPPFATDPFNDDNFIDATVIVEVLSPSTVRYDQTEKFEFYQEMPSFRHYILVEPTQTYVEHHYFTVQNKWQKEIFKSLGDSFRLDAIDCDLKISEIYEDIDELDELDD